MGIESSSLDDAQQKFCLVPLVVNRILARYGLRQQTEQSEYCVVGESALCRPGQAAQVVQCCAIQPVCPIRQNPDLCHCPMEFSKCRYGETSFTKWELKVPPSKTLLQKISASVRTVTTCKVTHSRGRVRICFLFSRTSLCIAAA